MGFHRALLCAIATFFSLGDTVVAQSTFSYTESNEIISNPERGLFLYAGDSIDHSEGCWFNRPDKWANFVYSLSSARSRKMTLVYLQYDIGKFRSNPMVDPKLYKCIQADFDAVRNAGFKVVLRFSYNPRKKYINDKGVEYDVHDSDDYGNNRYEASAATISSHLKDKNFVSLIRDNAELIAVWQAGTLGKYGEWSYTASDVGLSGKPNMKRRADILNLMLAALPSPGVVQVRSPYYREYSLKYLSNAADANRIGVFHDSLFSPEPNESGTYESYADPDNPAGETETQWREKLQSISSIVPVGGETNNTIVYPYPRKTPADIPKIFAEFTRYHWSYFNEAKVKSPLKKMDWTVLRSKDETTLERKLGYRLWLATATFPLKVMSGNDLNVTLTVNNTGWAAPFNRRKVDVFLCPSIGMSGNAVCKSRIRGTLSGNTDVRTWQPNAPANFSALIKTGGLPKGEYYLFLSLADRSENLMSKPMYSIRLANVDDAADINGTKMPKVFAWHDMLGLNRFGNITIQ